MAAIFLGFLICYLCFSVGRALCAGLRLNAEEDELFVVSTALGLGILAYAVLVLGLLHLLRPAALWGLLAVFTAFAIVRIRPDLHTVRAAFRKFADLGDGFTKMVLAVAGIVLIPVIAGILAPDISNDSLCYHLHLPKIFLASGSIGPVPFEVNALFPFFMEMFYTLGLGIYGLPLAQFFHFATGVLATLGIVAFARRWVPLKYAWWGGALFFATPLAVNQMATTYIDLGLACFTWVAMMALFRWIETKKQGWLILAAVFSGFMLSIKYLGLVSVLCFFIFIAWSLFKEKAGKGNYGATLGIFAAVVFLFGGYWYLRSWFELGNPVYPYFVRIFGAGDPNIDYSDVGVKKTIWNLLRVFWDMAMSPKVFEGFGVQIGAGYLAFLPMAFLAFKKVRWARHLFFFALFFLICWFFLGQTLRFFLPALPALAVLIAFGFALFDKGDRAGTGMRTLLVALLLFQAGLGFYHYRSTFKVAAGLESKEAYLLKMERSYSAAQFVNRELPADAKILATGETHLFYFNRPIVRESIYAKNARYDDGVRSPEEVLGRLTNDGFTHVLLATSAYLPDSPALSEYRIPRMFHEQQNRLAPYFKLVYNQKYKSPEGHAWTYRLYELKTARIP